MSPITFAAAGGDPSDPAVLTALLEAAGVPARLAAAGEPANIAHGTAAVSQGGLRIPLSEHEPDWRSFGSAPDVMTFDIVSAARHLLDDAGPSNSEPDAFDRHGRLRAGSAVAASRLATTVPIINIIADQLAIECRRRFSVVPLPRWPDGRRAAIALSHDVDRPERYAAVGDLWRPWRMRRAPRTRLTATLRLAAERLTDRRADDHWAFDELMALEDRHGVRSTVLFSVTPHHARFGSTLDPAYDASGARYRRVFERLTAGGWEIGLHASYRAFERPDRLAGERRRLAELAGVEIQGLRHHYWQLGPNPTLTFRGQEAAGFMYDASIGFNDAPGFRRGIALPFHVFDHDLGRPLRILEMPTTLMDGNLFYQGMERRSATAAAIAHLETVRQHGGLGVVDWHSHASARSNRRFESWGETYEDLLVWLSDQPDIWTAPLGQIAEWWRSRAGRLRALAEVV